ncbi:putative rRNA large subunit m3Psi methyltransferase RlmH [delta proteobacterium NaphS2]|nr:putative rRNA large subunit m3Psi methyltransferase RlmH [delta proteobacterium NaphS2]
MPKIKIIVVGNTKSSFLKTGESLYLKRLKHYTSVEWIEVKPEKATKGTLIERVLTVEGRSIEKRFHSRDHIVVLDVSGKEYSSEALSKRIERLSLRGHALCFVIGGPLGISKELLDRAHETLSLSKLTLTHEMSRVLLLEQLYRSFTIIRGEKYHK